MSESVGVSTEDTHTNPFDEIPDWYVEPELDQETQDPEFVPPPLPGGLAAGNVNPTRTMGKKASLVSTPVKLGLGLMLLAVLAVYAFVTSGEPETNPEDLVVGACASDRDTESSALRAAVSIECDDFNYGQITAVFDGTPEQMPAVGSGFWVAQEQQCEDWAVTPGRFTALAVAESDQEWAEGNRSIICISI